MLEDNNELYGLELIVEEKSQKVGFSQEAFSLQKEKLRQVETDNAKLIGRLAKRIERKLNEAKGYARRSKVASSRISARQYLGHEIACYDEVFLLKQDLDDLMRKVRPFKSRYTAALTNLLLAEKELEIAKNNLVVYQEKFFKAKECINKSVKQEDDNHDDQRLILAIVRRVIQALTTIPRRWRLKY